MILRREFIVRGKRVELEEIEGVAAVKTEAELARRMSSEDLSRAFGARAEPPRGGTEKKDWEAFQNAGWMFVRPSADVDRSLRSRSPIENIEAVQRVFRHPNGRILLGTDLLSIRLRNEMSEDQAKAILQEEGLEIVRQLRFAPNLFEVRTRPGRRDSLQVSLDLSSNPNIVYAEPQFIEHIPPRFTPTDPDYGQQWHLNNSGQNGGTAGADISAEEAWDITRGAGVQIAIIDNGFDLDHPDLGAAVTDTSGFFRMDGMGNAQFVQDVNGYPDSSHGTFCAGMAIARANNGEGGCGVANQADFIAVACLGDQVGTQVTLARAVAYAADPRQEVLDANPDDGADIIACSLGPNGADWNMTQTLQDAIDFAVTNGRGRLGTPILWAVTNGNFEIRFDEVCSYPNTIHVGRSTNRDREDDCGFGPELDFLATGVDVYSTDSGGGYTTSTGTSFAAPTAAGVATLLLAVNPNLTWQEVRQRLRDTCDKIGGVVYDANGHNNDYGWGRVNAYRVVTQQSRQMSVQEDVS